MSKLLLIKSLYDDASTVTKMWIHAVCAALCFSAAFFGYIVGIESWIVIFNSITFILNIFIANHYLTKVDVDV